MADKLLSGLFISEFLADNAGGQAFDTDGDGRANKADEYVELQNASGAPLSLDGIEIWSGKLGLLFAFPDGETLAPGETATIVAEYSGTPPAGFYDAGEPNNVNWLLDGEGNKFDTLLLLDTNTGDYVTLTYGQPVRPETIPPGFPGTTKLGAGETIVATASNGRAIARDTDGNLVETDPTPGTPNVPCFVPGTLIETEDGSRPVEALVPGTRVMTFDHGAEPVLAIGRMTLSALTLRRMPHLAPVEIQERLLLSPAHRVLVSGFDVALLAGAENALVPAHAFGRLQAASGGGVTYIHILMARHEILCANGIWVESLYAGEVMEDALETGTWTAGAGIDPLAIRHPVPARPILRGFEAVVLTAALAA
ncbi:MAG: Hint domain-containing protein [Pseudomonadota bacterium]